MLVVHARMAELYRIKSVQKLTAEQQDEMDFCLQVNEAYFSRLAALENQSYLASLTNDTTWHHSICAQIEKLERNNVSTLKKIKKLGA